MSIVNAQSETVAEMNANETQLDVEVIFRAHYGRVARIIARVVRNPARAEELAVEVFLKLWRSRVVQSEKLEGWLYRAAVHAGLDELRRQARRCKYEGLLGWVRMKPAPATPEVIHSASEEQNKVRAVLSAIEPRQAEWRFRGSSNLRKSMRAEGSPP